jgi:hypothetical protein
MIPTTAQLQHQVARELHCWEWHEIDGKCDYHSEENTITPWLHNIFMP